MRVAPFFLCLKYNAIDGNILEDDKTNGGFTVAHNSLFHKRLRRVRSYLQLMLEHNLNDSMCRVKPFSSSFSWLPPLEAVA
jgi:hypothetical protein